MADVLVNSASPVDKPEDRRIYGMVNAKVISNCDKTFSGRVQVSFAWLPGYEPWARVATPMAGKDCGMFFIPQEGQEVLVAFNHGYINEPYVVGSLYNGHDKPDEKTAKDPSNQRAILTPKGQELAFDDSAYSITISIKDGARVTLNREKIELVIGSASIILQKGDPTLKKGGEITLKSDIINLDAPTINVKGGEIKIDGPQGVTIYGGPLCSIDATTINIGSAQGE